jgi:hypothetical protein
MVSPLIGGRGIHHSLVESRQQRAPSGTAQTNSVTMNPAVSRFKHQDFYRNGSLTSASAWALPDWKDYSMFDIMAGFSSLFVDVTSSLQLNWSLHFWIQYFDHVYIVTCLWTGMAFFIYSDHVYIIKPSCYWLFDLCLTVCLIQNISSIV